MRTVCGADLEKKAKTSFYHRQYLSFYLDLGDRTVLTNHSDITIISSAIKTRTKLIDLNYYKPRMESKKLKCSLKNLHENETVFYFMTQCPLLQL